MEIIFTLIKMLIAKDRKQIQFWRRISILKGLFSINISGSGFSGSAKIGPLKHTRGSTGSRTAINFGKGLYYVIQDRKKRRNSPDL